MATLPQKLAGKPLRAIDLYELKDKAAAGETDPGEAAQRTQEAARIAPPERISGRQGEVPILEAPRFIERS